MSLNKWVLTVKKVSDIPAGEEKIGNLFLQCNILAKKDRNAFSMLFALPKQTRVGLLDREARNFVGENSFSADHNNKTDFPCDSNPQSHLTFEFTKTMLIYCFAGGVGFTLGLVDFWDKSELFIYIMVRTLNWLSP